MGLNFRKSFKIGKHTRINLTKSGIGLSTGVKGARVSVGPKGVRHTVGIPGTGIYYTKQTSLNKLGKENNPGINNNRRLPTQNNNNKGCGCLSIIAIIILISIFSHSVTPNNKPAVSNNSPKANIETQVSKSDESKSQTDSNKDISNSQPAAVQAPTPASAPAPTVNQNDSSIKNNSNNQATVVSPAPVSQQSSDKNKEQTVYITNTGKKYHTGNCRYLRKSKISIKLKDAESEGYGPCSVCNPPQ